MSLAPYDPPVINSFYQADPAAHVFSCKPDTVYIYGSHDWNSTVIADDVGGKYDMKDYYVLSQKDISKPAKVLNKILDLPEVKWAEKQFWAPDVLEHDGTYYLYFPAKDYDGLFRIGVATSKTPDGHFKPEKDYIKGSYSIDPAVLYDDKGGHLYFGGLWGGQLQAWTNNVFNASAIGPISPKTGPALGPRYAKLSKDLKQFAGKVKEITILDKDGKPMKADSPRRFFEGSSINKVGKEYIFQYSTGDTHTVEIAIGKKPEGPFKWRNTLLQPVAGWTTHQSITKFKNQWLLYYADASQSGQDNLRNTKVRKLNFEDGTFKLAQPQPTQPAASKAKRFEA